MKIFLYFEEIDLCKRFNLAKIKILIDPSLEVHHVEDHHIILFKLSNGNFKKLALDVVNILLS